MGKKLYINSDKLMAIKESMANDNSICHTNSCHVVKEAAPEVDEYEIGAESDNPPVGGNYYHVTESKTEIPQKLIDFVIKNRPDKYSTWVVVDLFNLSTFPRYFEKKAAAYDFYRFMRMGGDRKPVILNLDKLNMNINEGYSYNKLNGIDLSEVGLVEYEWYFDEDEYAEWLQDSEVTDSEDVRNQYYTEEVTYGVEYFDNETFHYMASDQNLLYDDLVDLFGEDMAKQMLQNCIDSGGGKFETYELYEKNSYNLNNPKEVNDIAMKLFSHGEYYKDCRGFILSNGVVVYTPSEHNEICMIPGVESKFDFIELGNIRLLQNSIDIGSEPTREQEEVLRQVISSYEDEELYLDIFDKGKEIGVKYVNPDWRYVIGEIDRYYSEGIRPQGNNGLYENIEYEVNPNEIELSSFKKKDELVPNIWENNKLDSRIRLKLLDIADDFWEFVNLTWVKPKNIILTGSICNFNWSSFSDIDLHLVVDFKEVDEKTEFVRSYLDSKKNEWNNEHENLNIFGHQVELYVQDIDETLESDGIYDLEENDWIKEPKPDEIKPIELNKFSIKDKAAKIMTIIDDMYDAFSSTDDSYKVRKIGDDASYLWKKIKSMREISLDKDGESGNGNIVYKIMRRHGYLDKLWKLSNLVYDKSNSITENLIRNKSVKKYLTLLKEEYVGDGNSEHNPYKKRWEAERKALKDFVSNYGQLMQSKEDNKDGKLYKCYWDKYISNLIGYNYCLCVQWDNIKMKPKSVVYVRALDKFTPNIKQSAFDTRGFDNTRGTIDDLRY